MELQVMAHVLVLKATPALLVQPLAFVITANAAMTDFAIATQDGMDLRVACLVPVSLERKDRVPMLQRVEQEYVLARPAGSARIARHLVHVLNPEVCAKMELTEMENAFARKDFMALIVLAFVIVARDFARTESQETEIASARPISMALDVVPNVPQGALLEKESVPAGNAFVMRVGLGPIVPFLVRAQRTKARATHPECANVLLDITALIVLSLAAPARLESTKQHLVSEAKTECASPALLRVLPKVTKSVIVPLIPIFSAETVLLLVLLLKSRYVFFFFFSPRKLKRF